MEVSSSTSAASTAHIRQPEPLNKLATLRALQKALETEQREVELARVEEDGKGRLLDLRC